MVLVRFFASRLALALAIAASTSALAADKKAESELRFALNACGRVLSALERSQGMDPKRASNTVLAAEEDYKKFLTQAEKARAIDASVLTSETVFNKKDNVTFAQMYGKCVPLAAEFDAARKQQNDVAAAYEEGKKAEREAFDASVAKQKALDEVRSAVDNECAIFRKWKSSSDFDDRLARYEQHKKAALAALPTIANEKHTATLLGEGAEAKALKTVAEWFAFCDKMMPEQAAKVRAQEKASAAAEQADAEKRAAMNDRLRAEEQAKFKALVAATGGDRKRILQAKGFPPHWPRGGDLKSAPVWKWEVNITHEAQRCETYQFSGDKLTKSFTSLGGCG